MTSRSRWNKAALFVNTRSRKGARLFREARERLAAEGVPLDYAVAERTPARLRRRVEEAIAGGADLIIVGGGDGSISGTIGALCGSRCAFAPLPLGTANSFALTLGLDGSLDDAVAAIVDGSARWIDMAEIDGHMFANSASLGLSPIVGDTIPPRLKRYLGRVGYLVWALRNMARFSPFRVLVEGNGERHECWTTEVRMLKGRYVAGVEMSEDARLDSGTITLQIVTGRSRWKLAHDWYLRILGLSSHSHDVIELEGSAFGISARPPQRVSIDGEVLARTPFDLIVHRKALRVVVPAAAAPEPPADLLSPSGQ